MKSFLFLFVVLGLLLLGLSSAYAVENADVAVVKDIVAGPTAPAQAPEQAPLQVTEAKAAACADGSCAYGGRRVPVSPGTGRRRVLVRYGGNAGEYVFGGRVVRGAGRFLGRLRPRNWGGC